MPRGRPRLDAATNAQNRPGRSLGDAELVGAVPEFPALPRRWRAATRDAFRTYERSETARALRAEDIPAVMRLFAYTDELAQRWDAFIDGNIDDERDALAVIRALESMATALATSLGIGPRARQSLGIKTETKPGSRLEAFRADGGA